MTPLRRILVLAALTVCAVPAQGAEKLNVVASFSILGDMVRNVGGERIALETLVGANSDTHVYAPAPADAKKLADAKVVFVNGLGFEGWMERLARASGTGASVVVVTSGIAPRQRDGARGSEADPHAWQSVTNAKIYVANIRDALIAADPSGRSDYETATVGYLAALDALDREIKATIAQIPVQRRKVITTHDAFGYFSAAYGIAFIAPQGVSTESEISARDLSRIINQIKGEQVPAVFLENVADPRLMQRIAAETGAKIGGALYSDALSDARGPAATYLDMMRNNVREFARALTP
jgi:zinc/manganese transport system substrate-binding protein